MRAKLARRVARENQELAAKVARARDAAAAAFDAAEEARAEAASREERLAILHRFRDDARAALKDVEDRVVQARVALVEGRDAADRAEAEAERTARVAEGLRQKLADPRFEEARVVLARAAEAKAAEAVRAEAARKLSPENVEGLKLLKRAFDPAGIKAPDHVVVDPETGIERDLDEDDVSLPCPDCGAEVGEVCRDVPHPGDDGYKGPKGMLMGGKP